MNIEAWLEGLGLEQYASVFIDNGIDAALLPELTNEDLRDIGVGRLADRKAILRAIAQLSEGGGASAGNPPALTEIAGEHRQVTVLFADIAGYTRLSSELGAEATHALLNRYFETVDGVIQDYGGAVNKHMGDNVMAVFGAPIAHDDDPLRAVRAALDIHDRMSELSRSLGRQLQAHIGVASGQVVASRTGSEAHREYTVTGDSVNLASRLQDKAAPGETLISDALHRVVGDRVDCGALGDVVVKGIDTPVRVWQVKTLRATNATIMRGAFVGRRSELAQFTGVIEACRASGNGQTIIVCGEAGIGKTRLVEELIRIAIDKGFAVHKGLVLDFGVGKGRDAIRSVVRGLLGIEPGSGKAARQLAAQGAVARGLVAPERRIFLNDLLDLPQSLEDRATYDAMSNTTRNEGKRTVVADLLRRTSAKTPVVVVVEDVHWANPLMLEYLARIAATAADCPALLVMTSRIEGDPLDRAWRATTGGCPLMTIDLVPLRRDDALRLASTFIDATNQFALACVERAEGNPLFLEQLLRNAEEYGDTEVPASIQSLVSARMDLLSPMDKQALQAASVLGQSFSLDALRHLTDNAHYTCAALIERHLVRSEGDDYLFTHALVQEGVYTSLLTARRSELHRKAAAWYGEQEPVLRAEHLDRGDDPTAAASYLEAAKAQAVALHFETALRLTERGIQLAHDPVSKCDLMCLRGDTLRDMGATEASIAAFETALGSADDDARRCRAWIGMAAGLRVIDRQASALEALEKAEAIAVDLGLSSERARIHYLRGNVFFPLGNIQGCLEQHEKALHFAREIGSTEAEALALGGLGDAYYLRGHMRTACQQFQACIELCRQNGYGRIEVANRHMVGWSRIHLMEFAEALRDAMDTIKLAADVSHQRAEVLGIMLAGQIEINLGRTVEAQEHLERGLALAQSIGAGNFEAQSHRLLARLYADQGRMPDARDHVQRAVGLVRKIGMKFIGPSVLADWASMSDDKNESRKALEEAERILDSGCVAHNQFWFAQTAIDHALAVGDWDSADRYATRLEAFTREQPLAWPDFMIARGRALAACGRGSRTEDLAVELKRLRDLAVTKGLKLAAANLALASTDGVPRAGAPGIEGTAYPMPTSTGAM